MRMRKKLTNGKMAWILAVVLVLFMATGVAEEERTDAGGQWLYVLEEAGATIAGYVGEPTGDLVVPNEVDGYPVTGFGRFVANDHYEGEGIITSVTIPDTVLQIFPYPFTNFPKLECVEVSPGNPAYESVDGVLFDKRQGMLVVYPMRQAGETYAMPEGTRSIGRHAFALRGELAGITLPNSITNIGDYAFCGCYRLTSIIIPGSVTGIGDSAFSTCGSLTDAILMDGVTEIGASAFSTCRRLTHVTIPSSVTSIGYWAFEGCNSLTSLTIPANVTSIGEDAFANCGDLTLVVPEGSYAEQYAKENGIPYALSDIHIAEDSDTDQPR